jgi:hypothetical protein
MGDDRKEPDDKPQDNSVEGFLKWSAEERVKGYTLARLFTRLDSWERRTKALESWKDNHEESHVELEERVEQAHDRLDTHRQFAVDARRREKKRHASEPEFTHDEMDTGTFDMVAIQRAAEDRGHKRRDSERVRNLEAAENERKDSSTWLKRHIITVVTSIITALVASLIATIIALAVVGAKQPLPQPIITNQK